eukprot:5948497-Heterocapsa_arctica.AAC.1
MGAEVTTGPGEEDRGRRRTWHPGYWAQQVFFFARRKGSSLSRPHWGGVSPSSTSAQQLIRQESKAKRKGGTGSERGKGEA